MKKIKFETSYQGLSEISLIKEKLLNSRLQTLRDWSSRKINASPENTWIGVVSSVLIDGDNEIISIVTNQEGRDGHPHFYVCRADYEVRLDIVSSRNPIIVDHFPDRLTDELMMDIKEAYIQHLIHRKKQLNHSYPDDLLRNMVDKIAISGGSK